MKDLLLLLSLLTLGVYIQTTIRHFGDRIVAAARNRNYSDEYVLYRTIILGIAIILFYLWYILL